MLFSDPELSYPSSVIHKHRLPVENGSETVIETAGLARVTSIGMQYDVATVWYEHDFAKDNDQWVAALLLIRCVYTGHEYSRLPGWQPLGHLQLPNGIVVHYFAMSLYAEGVRCG